VVNRREFMKIGGFSAASPLTRCSNRNQKQPNILFILTDQQTWRAMSCIGNPHLSTPVMDRLANEGVRFEQTYSTNPLCSPARSCLLTGRMPHETGVNWNSLPIKPGIPNMGKIFRENGYRTVWAGKWHLPGNYPVLKTFDGFEVLPFHDETRGRREYQFGDLTDEPLADAVVQFLNQPPDKPFLLGVSFMNPHDCCYVVRKQDNYPSANEIHEPLPPLPSNFAISPDEPQFIQEKRTIIPYGDIVRRASNWDENKWRAYLWNYYRMTERVDAALGKVLKALDDNGLSENTLVIFTSDHGDGVASHRWVGKACLYEESVRIPLIFRWTKRIPAGRTDQVNLVSQLDLLPTLCDYTGIPKLPEFRGHSLKKIIDNPKTKWREYVVSEVADDRNNPKRKGRMLRTGRYKYNIFSHGARNEQLFDLKNDPGETQNLAYEPTMQKILNEHRRLLDEWMKKTNDDFHIIAE